ncbi:MAG: serine hydrolase domain-containing protein, partial [Gemmataceae bacterium]
FRLAAVQRLLTSRYPSDGPGAAFLLVEADHPILLTGYGLADVAANVPVTPLTLFDLASVSKHITAYAVLMLASRGELAIDDEVREFLPELSRLDTGCRAFRLSDLLFHCSGLPEYTSELGPDEYAGFTNARLIDWLVEWPELDFPTGTRGFCLQDDGTTYCNTNYALLASVVERVSGVGFAHFLKTRLFEPLGMADTLCDPWRPDHPGQARRYDRAGQLILHPRVIPVVGDGNVYSTAADFVRWDAELAHPTLVPQDWLDRVWEAGKLDDGRTMDYAWGWYVRAWPGRRVAWHGGGWDGAATCFSRWLDDGVRLALFSNTQLQPACRVVSEIEEVALDR